VLETLKWGLRVAVGASVSRELGWREWVATDTRLREIALWRIGLDMWRLWVPPDPSGYWQDNNGNEECGTAVYPRTKENDKMSIKVTYDRSVDAAYIYFEQDKTKSEVHETRSLVLEGIRDGILLNLDFNEAGVLTGMEVLGASGTLPESVLNEAEIIG
jgi:uncharacterized protein YuzE